MQLDRHTAHAFDEDLEAIAALVAEMGAGATARVAEASALLLDFNVLAMDRLIASDRRLDAARDAIDERVVLTIARRQPVAIDLRLLVAAMRVANVLERVGDLAANVAKRCGAMAAVHTPRSAVEATARLGAAAELAMRRALDAYAARDAEAAEAVWRNDETLDGMFASLFRELLTHMAEDPRSITGITHLMFCAKNFERIGDHATAIAEAARYIASGRAFEGERPKIDAV